MLGLYRRQRDAFTGDHLRILLAISAKLGFSIENALKYQTAENSATTDYLTGLPNARSLFLHLDSELARCKRLQTPLAVVVCDLDGFKQVNDRFGHLVGNVVLRSVASGLKQTCREYDYVARMGGDEFVIIMPGFDAAAMKEKSLLFQSIAMEVGVRSVQRAAAVLECRRSNVPERRPGCRAIACRSRSPDVCQQANSSRANGPGLRAPGGQFAAPAAIN